MRVKAATLRSRDLASEVARVYLAAPRHPTKAVAEYLGITHHMAAKRVQACRREGLLPPTTKGASGRYGKGLHVARPFVSHDHARTVVLCDLCLVKWPCQHSQ